MMFEALVRPPTANRELRRWNRRTASTKATSADAEAIRPCGLNFVSMRERAPAVHTCADGNADPDGRSDVYPPSPARDRLRRESPNGCERTR